MGRKLYRHFHATILAPVIFTPPHHCNLFAVYSISPHPHRVCPIPGASIPAEPLEQVSSSPFLLSFLLPSSFSIYFSRFFVGSSPLIQREGLHAVKSFSGVWSEAPTAVHFDILRLKNALGSNGENYILVPNHPRTCHPHPSPSLQWGYTPLGLGRS